MLAVVILAAGRGTRMRTQLPKPLCKIGGMSLIENAIERALALQPSQVIVVGSSALFANSECQSLFEKLNARMSRLDVFLSNDRPHIIKVLQPEALGTGNAVQTAFPFIQSERVIILHADMPFVRAKTLQALSECESDLSIAIAKNVDPTSSFGRVLLHEGVPVEIIEAKDLSYDVEDSGWVNAAFYSVSYSCLKTCLASISKNSSVNEYYFTSMVNIAYKRGFKTSCVEISPNEAIGIDSPEALAHASLHLSQIMGEQFDDVIFQNLQNVTLSRDTIIGCGSTIEGACAFGRKVIIGKNVKIHPFCVLEDCTVEDDCEIGPFAHIHKGSTIRAGAVIGNFVEVKNSDIGSNSKAKHLAYIGDALLGVSVNVGAGTVFCNYDGVKKHHSTVECHASIGANVSLVAPIHIGENAYVGAGSVITKDVPAATLALSRAPQVHNEEWVRKKKYL
jgi:bifunctional UDP-N-acetylglucosamine pyrophosphorylase/glucosamine-1-phosphate N-acetyltransferase